MHFSSKLSETMHGLKGVINEQSQILNIASTVLLFENVQFTGGLLRGKEGDRDLRPSATAEVLPEDPDQAGEGAGEEVLREARRVHRPEENPAQANQEDQQVEAEEAQVGLRMFPVLNIWNDAYMNRYS